ncbi:hypothetical protein T265_00886 [Opisthorchis viverrini]|uniref:Uncharacterized protein n=1 Tax=Opisthorchis viverrini TaxID=6198 RepID=A0A075A0I8_OPIVI|nr:hypothetical protein T265_00886 [Opisthorchis viverrini]KER33188.1 hypothetical protein T265_00886 [Opisthorchis viverrini]
MFRKALRYSRSCVLLCVILLAFYVVLFSFSTLRGQYSADTGATISQETHALVGEYKQKCQCPSVKIWPQGYVHLPQLPVCKLIDSEQEDVWVEQGVLRIHKPIGGNKSRRICSVFPIIRMDDFISVYGEGVDDVSDHTKLPWPMVMVLCQPRENLEVKRSVSWDESAFKDQSRHFICGSHPPQKLPPPTILKNQTPGYNILLLGLDSVSHSAALRHLPKTMHMLETNPNAVTMQLYNVVGDGTTTNLLALLTGYFEDELPESRRSRVTSSHNTTVVDKYPWIWNTFSQVGGYATHYIEDSPKWGTFQYRLIGFGVEKTPTHSYGRPCVLAADKEHGKRLGCINSRYTHDVLLESLREFFHAYADRPRFSLTFLSELIHDNPAYATLLDDDLVTLLRQIQVNDEQDFLFDEPKPFSNTIVILFADHGPRLGGARLSVQGKLEERLPLLSFILPKRFLTDWPDAFAQLRANRDRLVTLFDVHATLKHLLIRQYGDHLDSAVKSPRGTSLFTPIRENRTCAQASIAPHWCVCLQWSDIRVSSFLSDWPPVVYTAAQHILSYVNQIVQRINSHRGMSGNVQKCQKMALSKITSAERASISKDVLRFQHSADIDGRFPFFSNYVPKLDNQASSVFRLHVVLEPGSAHFESTVHVNMTSGLPERHPIEISRLDPYESKAWCAPTDHLPEFRRFCVCGARD